MKFRAVSTCTAPDPRGVVRILATAITADGRMWQRWSGDSDWFPVDPPTSFEAPPKRRVSKPVKPR